MNTDHGNKPENAAHPQGAQTHDKGKPHPPDSKQEVQRETGEAAASYEGAAAPERDRRDS